MSPHFFSLVLAGHAALADCAEGPTFPLSGKGSDYLLKPRLNAVASSGGEQLPIRHQPASCKSIRKAGETISFFFFFFLFVLVGEN